MTRRRAGPTCLECRTGPRDVAARSRPGAVLSRPRLLSHEEGGHGSSAMRKEAMVLMGGHEELHEVLRGSAGSLVGRQRRLLSRRRCRATATCHLTQIVFFGHGPRVIDRDCRQVPLGKEGEGLGLAVLVRTKAGDAFNYSLLAHRSPLP